MTGKYFCAGGDGKGQFCRFVITAGFSVVCSPGFCYDSTAWFDREVTKLDSTIDEIAKPWTKTRGGEWYLTNIYR